MAPDVTDHHDVHDNDGGSDRNTRLDVRTRRQKTQMRSRQPSTPIELIEKW